MTQYLKLYDVITVSVMLTLHSPLSLQYLNYYPMNIVIFLEVLHVWDGDGGGTADISVIIVTSEYFFCQFCHDHLYVVLSM